LKPNVVLNRINRVNQRGASLCFRGREGISFPNAGYEVGREGTIEASKGTVKWSVPGGGVGRCKKEMIGVSAGLEGEKEPNPKWPKIPEIHERGISVVLKFRYGRGRMFVGIKTVKEESVLKKRPNQAMTAKGGGCSEKRSFVPESHRGVGASWRPDSLKINEGLRRSQVNLDNRTQSDFEKSHKNQLRLKVVKGEAIKQRIRLVL